MVKRALVVLSLLAAAPAFATVTATIDRPSVPVAEPFTLTLMRTGDAQGEPDWRPLEDAFQIAERGASTDYVVVDGRTTRRRTWKLVLIARREGAREIPRLRVGREHTQPVPITVTAARPPDPDPMAFVEIVVTPERPFVNQEVQVTTRVYARREVFPDAISELTAGPDAVVYGLTASRPSEVTRDSVAFDVVERTYVVFPMRPGELRLAPPVFRGQINLRPGPETPFGTRLPTGGLKPIFATAEVRAIPVQPAPPGDHGTWLPSPRVTLNERIEPATGPHRAGQPLTRIVELHAEAQFHARLPVLAAPEIRARMYVDSPEGQTLSSARGIAASRATRWTYVPDESGDLFLPEIRVAWWDTRDGQARWAVVPERMVSIAPALPPVDEPLPASAPPVAFAADTDTVRLAMAATILVALLAWRARRRRGSSIPPEAQTRRALRRALAAVRSGDAARARADILVWGRTLYGDRVRTLGDLGLATPSDALRAGLRALDRALYGAGDDWDRDALARALRTERGPARAPAYRTSLPALYPRSSG